MFDKKKKELNDKWREAEDVNNALRCIIPLSDEMNRSKLSDIMHLIPKLFNNIWVMWWISPNHYRKHKNLKEIMKKLADSLEHKCKQAIQQHIDNMFEGNYSQCLEVVDNSIKILDDFKTIFDKTMESVKKFKEEFYQKLKLH